MNSQTGKGRGRGLGKGKPPRDSRRPSPAKIQSDINRNCEGRTHTWNSNSTRSGVYSVKWDILPGIGPNRGTRDDSGINLKRAFGSFVGMTGDRDVSLPVLTTTPQQEIVQYSDFNMSHVPVVIWLSLLVFVEQFLFRWCSSAWRAQVENTVVLLGLRRNHSQIHLLLQCSNAHLGHINGLQHFESFEESHTIPTV